MNRHAKIGAVVFSAALLTVSSSLAWAMATRHVAWDGMVMGKDGSKIRGLIEMAGGKVSGTTAVSINYKGDTPGAVRPWHVHIGSCKQGGRVLGNAAAYPVLTVKADGSAEAKGTLQLALPDSGNFYVNVHESAAKMGTVVACGDLLLED